LKRIFIALLRRRTGIERSRPAFAVGKGGGENIAGRTYRIVGRTSVCSVTRVTQPTRHRGTPTEPVPPARARLRVPTRFDTGHRNTLYPKPPRVMSHRVRSPRPCSSFPAQISFLGTGRKKILLYGYTVNNRPANQIHARRRSSMTPFCFFRFFFFLFFPFFLSRAICVIRPLVPRNIIVLFPSLSLCFSGRL
jgi:hypothetical protein